MHFKFTNVEGFRIRYIESGDSDEHVLFIHGLGGSSESWINNISMFKDHFHVLAPDLIGFGRSDKPKINYNMKTFTNFVNRFMDSLGIKKANIIGSSMGGQIAAEFAISWPTKVERLVLISPAGVPPKEFKGTSELKKFVNVLESRNLTEVKNALVPIYSNVSTITNDYVKSVYSYITMPGARYAFLSSLNESAKAPRLVGRLRASKIRTLIVWGKDDNLIPVRYCEPFISKMKDCRLLILEKCGHRPHAEKPTIFNKTVIDFLEESK